MKLSLYNMIRGIFSCILILLHVQVVYSQEKDYTAGKIRVQGVVSYIAGNKPIENISVVVDGLTIAYTDIAGRYSILVKRDATILFSHAEYNDVVVQVDGRQQISVSMSEKMVHLEEVLVTAKASKTKIAIEPTDMEIKGDYVHLKTRVRIPTNLFKTDHRFIVQPTIYNQTRSERYLLRPVVIDGDNYKTVQHRYLNFDLSRDTLARFVEKLDIGSKDIYTYTDSLYMEPKQRDDDWQSDCYLVLVSYDKSQYIYNDTLTIAKGTQNVLRYFQYTLLPVQLNDRVVPKRYLHHLTNTVLYDSSYVPNPELELRSNQGSVNIRYKVNSAVIDTLDRDNKNNIEQIRRVLIAIQYDVNATLSSITLRGYASPDGIYQNNKALAAGRTRNLLSIITQCIDPALLEHVDLQHESHVSEWSDLADVMRHDNPELAEKVERIVSENKNDHLSTQTEIRKLPEYAGVIERTYLPRLRRVEYIVNYSMFTEVPVETLRKRYDETPELLSAFEYYNLIVNERNIVLASEMEKRAVKKYPTFIWALNRLSIRSLASDKSELSLLSEALNDKSPTALKYNQALTAIQNRNFYIADSLLNTIDDPMADLAKSVVGAFNGNYQEAFKNFGTEGSLNEVILLLALKEKNTAYKKMDVFMQNPENHGDARHWYVYATCANRNDDLIAAMNHLSRAIEIDPNMAQVAQIDAELIDIYELIEPKDKDLTTNEAKN